MMARYNSKSACKAYYEGRSSADPRVRHFCPYERCPYDQGTPEWDAWFDGFLEGLLYE